jgi:membrane-associated phospholipid phosphatase
MFSNWKIYFSEKRKMYVFLFTLLSIAVVLFSFLHFLTYNENRIGFVFNDPILSQFTPINVSTITFITTYAFGLSGLIIALQKPEVFIKLLQAYTIMTILRIICLYLVPLEPPVNIIPLKDIFLESSFYSGRENLKDLFFSGHTATVCLFAFGFENKKLRLIFGIGTIAVALLILAQHVHYSIDVIAAPIVSFIAVQLQQKLKLQ